MCKGENNAHRHLNTHGGTMSIEERLLLLKVERLFEPKFGRLPTAEDIKLVRLIEKMRRDENLR